MSSFFYLLGAALCWGIIGPVSKFLIFHGMNGVEIAFWRSLLGGFFFLLECRLVKNESKFSKADLIKILLFSIFAVAGLEVSNLLAVQYGGAAFASVLLYGALFWVALISSVFFKEKIGYLKSILLIVSVVGVTGFAFYGNSNANQFNIYGFAWGIISGFSYALFYIFGKYVFHHLNPSKIYAYAFLIAAFCIYSFVHFSNKSQVDWGLLLFIGFVSTYLAYNLYAKGLKRTSATKASIILTLEPVFATVFSILIWKESFGMLGWIFASMIMMSAVFSALIVKE